MKNIWTYEIYKPESYVGVRILLNGQSKFLWYVEELNEVIKILQMGPFIDCLKIARDELIEKGLLEE